MKKILLGVIVFTFFLFNTITVQANYKDAEQAVNLLKMDNWHDQEDIVVIPAGYTPKGERMTEFKTFLSGGETKMKPVKLYHLTKRRSDGILVHMLIIVDQYYINTIFWGEKEGDK